MPKKGMNTDQKNSHKFKLTGMTVDEQIISQ